MASNTSPASSMWLSDSESCYSQRTSSSSSSSSSPFNPPAFAAAAVLLEQRTPSPELPQPHSPRQADPSLLSQGIAEMRTLQAMAASKEKFIPPTLKPNTNTSQDNPQAGKPTTTIHLPSQSTLQAEQARIDAETRSRLEERQERLNRAVQRENWANSMFFMDMSGERLETENAGGWDSREWVCCGCEVYNSGHEFLCSHCRVHAKCGGCERREEGRLRLEGFEPENEEGVTYF